MIQLGTPTAPYAVTVSGDTNRNVTAVTFPVTSDVRTTVGGQRVRIAEIIRHSDGIVWAVCVRVTKRTGEDFKSGASIATEIIHLDRKLCYEIDDAVYQATESERADGVGLVDVLNSIDTVDRTGYVSQVGSSDFYLRQRMTGDGVQVEARVAFQTVGLVIRSEEAGPALPWAVYVCGPDGDHPVAYAASQHEGVMDVIGKTRLLVRLRGERGLTTAEEISELIDSNPWDARPVADCDTVSEISL